LCTLITAGSRQRAASHNSVDTPAKRDVDQIRPLATQRAGAEPQRAQPVQPAPAPLLEHRRRCKAGHGHALFLQAAAPRDTARKWPQSQHGTVAGRGQKSGFLGHAQFHPAQFARVAGDQHAPARIDSCKARFVEIAAQEGQLPAAQETPVRGARQPGTQPAQRLGDIATQHPARHAQQRREAARHLLPELAPAETAGPLQHPFLRHLVGPDMVGHARGRTEPGAVTGVAQAARQLGFTPHCVSAGRGADRLVEAQALREQRAPDRHVRAPHEAGEDRALGRGRRDAEGQTGRHQAQQPARWRHGPVRHDRAAEDVVIGLFTGRPGQAQQPVRVGRCIVVGEDEQAVTGVLQRQSQRGIERGILAAPGFADTLQRQPANLPFDDGAGTVGAAVVGNEQPPTPLRGYQAGVGVQHARQGGGTVVGCHENGQQGHVSARLRWGCQEEPVYWRVSRIR
jgi:hypothetical protein